MRFALYGMASAAALLLAGVASAQEVKPFRIAVLNDQSTVYSDASGKGSIIAAQLAIDDFGGTVLGRPIELLSADHQNKTDIASGIVRDWFDNKDVQAIFDLQVSSVALAAVALTEKANKVAMISSSGSSQLTGKNCSPNSVHWTYDTYAISRALPAALVSQGLDDWYFVIVDYAFGHAMESDFTDALGELGANIVGSVRVPLATPDFSSSLLSAQSSGADVVLLGSGGSDAVLQLKQASEFGLKQTQQLVSPASMMTEIIGAGLDIAQGLYVTESFYWDMNEETRAWSKRYVEQHGKPANMLQAGNYGSVLHYLKAVEKAGTTDGDAVVKAMKEIKINDFMTKDGWVREDGRAMRDMHVFQVKEASESKYPFDFYKLVETIPAEKVFRPLSEGECPFIKE